jgi:hypothetical protein
LPKVAQLSRATTREEVASGVLRYTNGISLTSDLNRSVSERKSVKK